VKTDEAKIAVISELRQSSERSLDRRVRKCKGPFLSPRTLHNGPRGDIIRSGEFLPCKWLLKLRIAASLSLGPRDGRATASSTNSLAEGRSYWRRRTLLLGRVDKRSPRSSFSSAPRGLPASTGNALPRAASSVLLRCSPTGGLTGMRLRFRKSAQMTCNPRNQQVSHTRPDTAPLAANSANA